jgi:hypothetical protein
MVRMRQLWEVREVLLGVITRAQQTLCHGDPSEQNLLDAGVTTVALDWAFTGIGAVGEDLAVLLRSRLPGTVRYAALDAALFEGYLAGLREAGWNGDPRGVRLGYTAAVALRYALSCWPVRAFNDYATRVRIEQSHDHSIEELVDWAAEFRAIALDRADEARSLAADVL